ncbi:MAG TPA: peptide deformylase [Aquificae bacterium]|nr:peptide deformylase [Aquificota bacterium]
MLELKYFPIDPVLREKAQKVEDSEFGHKLDEVLNNMIKLMVEKRGLGLAANQAGFTKRFFVLDMKALKERQVGHLKFDKDLLYEGRYLKIVNPEFIERQGEMVSEEGCLSIPGVYKKVKRNSFVILKAYTPYREEFIIEAEGIVAKALQHEFDHLQGTLFIDYLSPLQKRMFLPKYLKNLSKIVGRKVTFLDVSRFESLKKK